MTPRPVFRYGAFFNLKERLCAPISSGFNIASRLDR